MSRWLAVAVLAILLLVVGFQAANPHSYVAEAIARIGESGSGGGGISWDAYYLYGRDATWKVSSRSRSRAPAGA
jgi:hypothetical protein